MEQRKFQASKAPQYAEDRDRINSHLKQEAQAGSKINARPIRLVSHGISHDTVRALELVLEDAKKGKVVGVMLCVMYGNKDTDLANTDEFRRNPYLGRAIAAELDDYLSEQTKSARLALTKQP